MNLHRVPTTERDVRATFTSQVKKLALAANPTIGTRMVSHDLGTLVSPEVKGEQRPPQLIACTGQELERFSSGQRSGEIHYGIQNAAGFASFQCSARGIGEDARQTRCLAREDGERRAIAG